MKRLFDETRVKNMELENRFIRSALWMKMAEDDGHLNKEILDYYEKLADGGVGLILTGYAFICGDEQPNARMLGVYDDSFIKEYKEMVDRVHNKGSKIALQIVYGGSQNHHPNSGDMKIFGPSAVKNRVTGIIPIEADKSDIENIVEMFAHAALRGKKAGFDAVQVHAGHGYFLSQFLTPFYNRREDSYGGDIKGRTRIIVEVIRAIREKVGNDYPIMIKMNYDDFMDEGEGLTEYSSMEAFKIIDDEGIDMIEVSAVNESSGKGLGPALKGIRKPEKQSYFKDFTKRLSHNVASKVILMGGNRNMDVMENIINSSDIEYVSIARPLLCEMDLINKWRGNRDYKPKCVSCNKCWESSPNSCVFSRNKGE